MYYSYLYVLSNDGVDTQSSYSFKGKVQYLVLSPRLCYTSYVCITKSTEGRVHCNLCYSCI